jgi:hypothetical protein
MQDYNGTLFFDNVKNKTIPSAMARYNFDYDVYGKLIDVGIKGKRYNATWNGINTYGYSGNVFYSYDNATTSKFTGTWTNKQNVFDNNWGTYGRPESDADDVYFNYSIDLDTITLANLTIKYRTASFAYIDIPKKCFRNDRKLVFRIDGFAGDSPQSADV